MSKALLIDIGGTNVRYAFASTNDDEISEVTKLLFDENKFGSLLSELIYENNVDSLIISVAGPKINNSINMTNKDYSLNSDELKKQFNLNKCYLLNDWEAIAHSYDYVSKDIKYIKKGNSFNNTKLFLGPGTGLGASISINDTILPSEIGNTLHSSLRLQKNYQIESPKSMVLEDFISGSAISNLYEVKSNQKISSKEVFNKSRQNDPVAKIVTDGFIKSLAETLSELALTFIPGDGIFLAGSLIRNIFDDINKENFNDIFLSNRKAAHKEMLNMVSIGVIMKKRTPLYGNLKLFKIMNK
tara:strand:+ start:1514 stop:2413 length:900 start_codon:yes stop_codon:yes gene_type:complete